jgi:hypothetical protein
MTCSADSLRVGSANLALKKPATASSIENDEHNAAAANDGNPDTCWRADDEPEGSPDWWQVDLKQPAELSGCVIRWPFKGANYRYKVEGSTDGKGWSMLSDQSQTKSRSQVHELTFRNATGIRFLKITVTGFDDGYMPSISEVKVFGKELDK